MPPDAEYRTLLLHDMALLLHDTARFHPDTGLLADDRAHLLDDTALLRLNMAHLVDYRVLLAGKATSSTMLANVVEDHASRRCTQLPYNIFPQ